MKRYKKVIAICMACIVTSTTVLAQEITQNNEIIEQQQNEVYTSPIFIEGKATVTKSSTIYNINPYNPAKIEGLGESGSIRFLHKNGMMEIPLSYPLYKLSDAYADKIVCKNGIWGVERNVGMKIFDGTEDWQKVKEGKFYNKNTTIFECTAPEKVLARNGLCTHFDVHLLESQLKNIYDGISFSENREKIYMRTMNVKNMSTIETLSSYLKAQYDAGTPVKFLYALEKCKFEPFDEAMQSKLNAIDWQSVGFLDTDTKIGMMTETELNQDLFTVKQTGNDIMNQFLSAITDIKIYGETDQSNFYIMNIATNRDTLGLSIKNDQNHRFYGEIRYDKIDFLSSKPTEIRLEARDNAPSTASAEVKINLSKLKAPVEGVYGFDSSTTGISNNCIQQKELILTAYTPVVEGIDIIQYPDNALINGAADNIVLIDKNGNNINTQQGISLLNADSPMTIALENDDTVKASTEIIKVKKQSGAGLEKTVLFLGDSLINENAYTNCVLELFQNDDMNIKLIGTRGTEQNKHEGRGGWSAYDYCNETTKYGFTNPFLNNGKFDFSYYMKNNGYDNVDYVVVSIGVNDLNIVGHNSHDEIIHYFNTIFDSIHQYNTNTKIILNIPTMLFSTESTDGAKNTRLEFTKTLIEQYSNKELDGIYLSAISMAINPSMNFKWTESIDKSQPMKVSDTTHPNMHGYKNMATTTYAFLKYLAEIEG